MLSPSYDPPSAVPVERVFQAEAKLSAMRDAAKEVTSALGGGLRSRVEGLRFRVRSHQDVVTLPGPYEYMPLIGAIEPLMVDT